MQTIAHLKRGPMVNAGSINQLVLYETREKLIQVVKEGGRYRAEAEEALRKLPVPDGSIYSGEHGWSATHGKKYPVWHARDTTNELDRLEQVVKEVGLSNQPVSISDEGRATTDQRLAQVRRQETLIRGMLYRGKAIGVKAAEVGKIINRRLVLLSAEDAPGLSNGKLETRLRPKK